MVNGKLVKLRGHFLSCNVRQHVWLLPFVSLFLLVSACGEDTYENKKIEEAPLSAALVEKMVNAEGYPKSFINKNNLGEITSFLVTNIDTHFAPNDEIIVFPVKYPIYNISFIRYSKKISDLYGYSKDYITDMPTGIQLVEFVMKTVGSSALCDYNFLIDKDDELFFPPAPFERTLAFGGNIGGIPLGLPARNTLNDGSPRIFHNELIKKAGYENKYTYTNYYISSVPYKPETGKPGMRLSLMLAAYYPDLFSDMDYVSFRGGCSEIVRQVFEEGDAYIWFITKDGYNRSLQDSNAKNIYKIKSFPSEVVNFILNATEGYESGFIYRNVLHGYYGR